MASAHHKRRSRADSDVAALVLVPAAFISLGLVALVATWTSEVDATNFGSTGNPGVSNVGAATGVWLQPDRNLLVKPVNLDEDAYIVAITSTLTSGSQHGAIPDWTIEIAAEDVECGLNGGSICIHDLNAGNVGLQAWNQCDNTPQGTHPNQTCARQKIYINLDQDVNSAAGRLALMCHEIGHSRGLRHGTQTGSCMQNPPPTGTGLTAHDRNHIEDDHP